MRVFKTLLLTAFVVLSLGASSASAATPSVRVALDYACALTEAGNVSCWGANALGQLGNGTVADSSTPVAVLNVANAVQLDVGLYGACALIADGTVKCWGATQYGGLGTDSPSTPTGTATTIAGLTGVTRISVGEATSCAIVSSPAGTLKCWGYGSAGQLGVPAPPVTSETPVTVNLGAPVTDVGVGEFHACAVAGGAMKCWGTNSYNAVLPGDPYAKYDTPQQVAGLESGVALASAGASHTCAVMTTGALKCWGGNGSGQSGTGLTGNSDTPQNSLLTSGVTSIGYGESHRCALVGDSARCFGSNSRGQIGDGTTTGRPSPTIPAGMAFGVTSLDAGGSATCAIVNKVVKCWGDNASGVLGNGTSNNHNTPVQVAGVSGVSDVDVSEDHACAISSGLLNCWGSNSNGQFGDGTSDNSSTSPVSASTFGAGQTAIATSRGTTCSFDNGAVKCAGYGYFGQLGNSTSDTTESTAATASVLTTGNGLGKIDGGYQSFCALPTLGANNRKIYCWGSNSNSVLGQGLNYAALNKSEEPLEVTGVATDATSIDVGSTHTCAVVTGAVRCWGRNYGGSVTGSASNVGDEIPDPVTPGLSNVSTITTHAVAVSYGSTCAIVTSPSGGIKCFGEGNNGTLGQGSYSSSYTPVDVSGITGATAIAAGQSAVCAVVTSSVRCWGRNDKGQLGNGTNVGTNSPVTVPGITDALSVAGQGDSFCARLLSGNVKCWGEGYYGQLGAGGSLFATTPGDVSGVALFQPDPPAAYVKQKIKATLKLNGKIKKSGKTKISVPLKLYFAAPAGSNAATVCVSKTTISIKTSKKKTTKLKVNFKRKGPNCSFTGKIKLPKSFKGKKKKFTVSVPTNADVLAYKSTKTLKLK